MSAAARRFAPGRLPPRVRTVLQAAAVAVFVQVPTSAELYKYTPNHRPALLSILTIAVTFVGAVALFTSLERFAEWRRFAGSRTVTVLLLGAITAVSPFAYHLWARHLPKGTSASAVTLAMTLPVHALLGGHHMYDIALPASVPASPGPGWIVLNAPFTLIHAPWLLIPFWLAAAAVVTRIAYGHGTEVNVALVLLLVSPHFARMVAENQDLLVVPCALILTMVITGRWVRSMPAGVVVAFLAGVVATSRLIYLGFPVVLSLMVWRRSHREAITIGAVGVGTAAVLHLVAAIGIHPYPPAHLFGRAGVKEPALTIAVGAVVTAMAVIGMLVRYARRDDGSWLLWLAGAWAVAHAFIGLGELAGTQWAFRYWEGANYVFVGAVALVAGVMAWRARSAPVPAPAAPPAVTAPV
jgi:hypothetical protein